MFQRRLYRFVPLILLLSLALLGGIVASAEESFPTEPDPVESSQTEPDPIEQDQTVHDPTEQEPIEPEPAEPEPTAPDPTEQDPTEPDPTAPDTTEQEPTKQEPTEQESTEPEPTEPDPTSALDELLKTVEAAEGVSEQSKRQLRERLMRLSERVNRFGPGIDPDAAIVAELEDLRDDDPELNVLIEAILAAYESGHRFDAIVSILIEPGSDTKPDDPTLAWVAEIAIEAELDEEENRALLAALQTEVEPSGELNRGQLVSTMAHIRNLERKARRDGVELSADQLTQLVSEGLAGRLSDDDIKTITEAALNSDRGMSEAVGHIKSAVTPNRKGRPDAPAREPEPEPSDDVKPPSEEEVSGPEALEAPEAVNDDDATNGTVNANGKGRPAAAASKAASSNGSASNAASSNASASNASSSNASASNAASSNPGASKGKKK